MLVMVEKPHALLLIILNVPGWFMDGVDGKIGLQPKDVDVLEEELDSLYMNKNYSKLFKISQNLCKFLNLFSPFYKQFHYYF